MNKTFARIAIITAVSISLAACGGKSSSKKATQAQAPLPVTVTTLVKKPIQIQYQSVGSFISPNNPALKAETTGKIQAIYVRTGDAVTQGELLAKLNDRREEIQYQKALAEYNEKSYAESRYKELAEKGIVAKLQYQQKLAAEKVAEQSLLAAKHNLDRTEIRSPINGHVEHIYVAVGGFVSPGEKLLSVINGENLQARLPFSQAQASNLKIGQQVKLYSPASPEYMLNGQINAIVPSINPQNRALEVIVKFSNAQNIWRIGASTHAEIALETQDASFVVPKESLVLSNAGDSIFIVRDNKAYEISNVQILHESGDEAAINAKGLQSGDQLVVDGAPYLSSGSPVVIKKPGQPAAKKAPAKK